MSQTPPKFLFFVMFLFSYYSTLFLTQPLYSSAPLHFAVLSTSFIFFCMSFFLYSFFMSFPLLLFILFFYCLSSFFSPFTLPTCPLHFSPHLLFRSLPLFFFLSPIFSSFSVLLISSPNLFSALLHVYSLATISSSLLLLVHRFSVVFFTFLLLSCYNTLFLRPPLFVCFSSSQLFCDHSCVIFYTIAMVFSSIVYSPFPYHSLLGLILDKYCDICCGTDCLILISLLLLIILFLRRNFKRIISY